jgi:hypothetical protein
VVVARILVGQRSVCLAWDFACITKDSFVPAGDEWVTQTCIARECNVWDDSSRLSTNFDRGLVRTVRLLGVVIRQ